MKKGQIVLFVIVLLTITLIIISSAVTRTLTGIKNNSINTDSTRAFNAAEAGIDELLKRSDLASLAGGSAVNINSVDKSTFSEAKYQVENADPGYFGLISKDTVLQVEFASDPTTLRVNYSSDACLELSFYSTTNTVTRRIICGKEPALIQRAELGNDIPPDCDFSSFPSTFNATNTSCKNIPFTITSADTLLIKVLGADSEIKLSADNYDTSFNTKPIKATAWATTKSGVKKEVQVITKTTNDIFPVFDNALYIR